MIYEIIRHKDNSGMINDYRALVDLDRKLIYLESSIPFLYSDLIAVRGAFYTIADIKIIGNRVTEILLNEATK